jgi:DNA-damage-inducible protein J|tara:strand:+ start:229 stop:381 length:153 start_codon:yes stop_codon:yes gene_type:complete
VAADVNSYDAWFRAQVQAALEDARAGTSQVQVMQAAQALIDAKRQGQSKP